MNGYFNNLALRSMNAGNLVEPRLPSLFEPQRGESDADASVYDAATPVYSEPRPVSVDTPPTESSRPKVSIEEPTAAEEVTGPQATVTTARPTRNPDEPPAPVLRSTHEQHTAPIDVAERPTGTESPTMAEPPTVATQTLPNDQTQTETPVATTSAVKSVQPVAHQPDKTLPSVVVTKVTPETFSAPQSRIEAEEATSAVEDHVSIVEEREVFFEPAPILKTPPLFKTEVQPEVVERLIERSRNTDKTDFRSVTRSITNYAWREPDPAEPEPSINITIGRVEVRAAPATNTKPTTTRQESPVMPLDEYLRKQRRGGER